MFQNGSAEHTVSTESHVPHTALLADRNYCTNEGDGHGHVCVSACPSAGARGAGWVLFVLGMLLCGYGWNRGGGEAGDAPERAPINFSFR